jgi:hypothetical protein
VADYRFAKQLFDPYLKPGNEEKTVDLETIVRRREDWDEHKRHKTSQSL